MAAVVPQGSLTDLGFRFSNLCFVKKIKTVSDLF